MQGTLRSLAGSFAGMPGVISLTAGFPPPSLFPFSSLSLRLHGVSEDITLTGATAVAAQQYNSSLRGHPSLLSWTVAHVAALHAPPSPHQVLITNGANHALELITSLFLDRGDTLLVEEYTYPVITESICGPKGIKPLPVPLDTHGIVPSGLRRVLSTAIQDAARPGGSPRPKMLYTIPTGHNPTGCTVTPERRREIYQICREYDVWIIEDDPYFYLQWDETLIQSMVDRAEVDRCGGAATADDSAHAAAAAAAAGHRARGLASTTVTTDLGTLHASVPGLTGLYHAAAGSYGPSGVATAQLPRSYLSMDVDQRVIRVDTFSKFLAPGLRLGWVTARSDVIDKLTYAIHAHTVGPCGFSQAVVSGALTAWGDAGLDAHLRRIQAEYAKRCAIVVAAAKRHLTGLAEWTLPRGGMFLWVRLLGINDANEVWPALKEARVIVCPGYAMHAGAVENPSVTSPCMRLAFSTVSEADLEEGVARFAQVLRRHVGGVSMPNGGSSAVSFKPSAVGGT
jgi:DNA-binding transcriptional MocR family regulator